MAGEQRGSTPVTSLATLFTSMGTPKRELLQGYPAPWRPGGGPAQTKGPTAPYRAGEGLEVGPLTSRDLLRGLYWKASTEVKFYLASCQGRPAYPWNQAGKLSAVAKGQLEQPLADMDRWSGVHRVTC